MSKYQAAIELIFQDGFYSIEDVQIYYKFFESKGASKKLIVLHGGPGATHDADLPVARSLRARDTPFSFTISMVQASLVKLQIFCHDLQRSTTWRS